MVCFGQLLEVAVCHERDRCLTSRAVECVSGYPNRTCCEFADSLTTDPDLQDLLFMLHEILDRVMRVC
jgi:hypothetical protein